MSGDPQIFLTMDNAFATKRWTKPDEWARIIRDLGIRHVEASADTEADPFYCGSECLSDWLGEVHAASAAHGVSVDNLYTGYTTYRTLGLAHPDARVRARVMDGWLKVMARIAAQLSAGLGFYLHAFSEAVLQDPVAYRQATALVYEGLAEVARYAGELGPVPIVVEQMYSPNQTPWTIEGTFEYLREVGRRSGFPAYVAVDTGHQTGQHRFLRPSREALERALAGQGPVPYLGPDAAYAAFEDARERALGVRAEAARRIEEAMDRFPYFFAAKKDCDLYRWLEELGCYAPILHLQQTGGRSSSHLPFTAVNNEAGIVEPLKVLQAIARSYRSGLPPGLPTRCTRVYLTFEVFPHTTDRPRDILPKLAESVSYWRRWVPEDGLRLSVLLGGDGSKEHG
jgi:sugar phosphate isomerase/epimerase